MLELQIKIERIGKKINHTCNLSDKKRGKHTEQTMIMFLVSNLS